LKPGEVPAPDVAAFVAAAEVAKGRFAVLCTASISGDTGGLATTGVCARVVNGRRLLIIVALARMKSFRAVTFRSFPEGEDPRRAGIIVELLRETTRREC
jgi:hypothetical protein